MIFWFLENIFTAAHYHFNSYTVVNKIVKIEIVEILVRQYVSQKKNSKYVLGKIPINWTFIQSSHRKRFDNVTLTTNRACVFCSYIPWHLQY